MLCPQRGAKKSYQLMDYEGWKYFFEIDLENEYNYQLQVKQQNNLSCDNTYAANIYLFKVNYKTLEKSLKYVQSQQ